MWWALVEALRRCEVPPAVFLQSSTATIYVDDRGPACGERGELVLKSRRVMPGRLLESGFAFEFPEWERTASDLISRRA